MSVLDSFVFLLKADTRDAVRGIEDTGEAFENLKEEGQRATRTIEKDTRSMGGAIKDVSLESVASFKAMATGMLGAVAAGASLTGIMEQLSQQVQRGRDAASTGVDIGSYQQLQYVFEKNNLEADDLRDTLFDINEYAGDAGKAESWKALGISVKDSNGQLKTADTLFANLAASVEGLSKGDATAKLRALGINDPRVIQTIMLGNRELQRQMDIRKAMGLQTNQDTENAKQFQNAVSDLGVIFDVMGEKLAASLAPALTTVVEGIQAVVKWAQEHKGFLVGFFGALSFVAIPALISALGSLAVAAWTAMAPFIPFIATAAALALVIDDLWSYFNGGNSVIGDLASRFPELEAFLQSSKKEVLDLVDAFKKFIDDPQAAMEEFKDFLESVWRGIIADAQKGIDDFINKVTDGFNRLTDEAKKPFVALYNFITGIFDSLGNAIDQKLSRMAGDAKKLIKLLPYGETFLNSIDANKTPQKPATQSPGGPDMAVPGDTPQVKQQAITGDLSPDHPLAQATVPAAAASSAVGMAAVNSNLVPSTNAQMLSGRGGYTDNSSRQVHVDKIEVNSNSADPRQVAMAVPGALNDHLSNTAQHFDDGVSH